MTQNAPVSRLKPTLSTSLDLDFKICLWPEKVAGILRDWPAVDTLVN